MEPSHDDDGPDLPPRRGARPIGLGLVLVVLGGMLILGAAAKAPCASGDWTDGRQYRLLCYTDIVPLLGTEQLAGGRLPFLQPCVATAGNCDEYPVLTMYTMRMAGWVSDTDYRTFFAANAALLWLCAGAIAVSLYAVVGGARTLMFALSPTLLVYGLVNWDLLAVALATAAVPALLVRRDVLAGVLLGLGASAKFYPAMFVVPFIAQCLQEREPDRAIRLGWATAGTWIAVNLPFFVASPSSWLTFFRFNSERCPDFDSLWSIGWRVWNAVNGRVGGACPTPSRVNIASAVAFVAVFALAWFLKARRWPAFPRWTLIFPLVVAFLLTNKVYSPQYGLWLVPLFALALPNIAAFVAFSIADVGVFLTRFWWFGHDVGLPGPVVSVLHHLGVDDPGVGQRAFELAVVIRAAVLIWCVIAWVRREPEVLPVAVTTPAAPAAALEAPP